MKTSSYLYFIFSPMLSILCLIIIFEATLNVSKYSEWDINLSDHNKTQTKAKRVVTLTDKVVTRQRKKDLVVIGIMSSDGNVCQRESMRKTFFARARQYKSMVIKVLFLLDSNTTELQREQNLHKDILFLNVTVHGWGNRFAKKYHIWISYVIDHYPGAAMIGKMDDDIFACTPQVFDRLQEVRHPMLYYGYPTPAGKTEAVDEMFIFIGKELAKRISVRRFCNDKKENNCLYDGNGGHQFRKWISLYSDIHFIDEKENNLMVWYYREFPKNLINVVKMFRTKSFCENFLVFHKASVFDVYRMTRQNSELLHEDMLTNYSSSNLSCMKKYLP